MRRFWLTFAGLLLAAPALLMAQVQPPAADPNAAKMEYVLGQWEKAMTAMNSVVTSCGRITIKKAFQTVEKYTGEARLLKTPSQPCRASLALYKEGRADVFDKIICTGTYIYVYDSSNKVIKIYDQPAQGQGQLNDNNFLDFLFGMNAGQAKQRYQILYYVLPPPQDEYYYCLRILPLRDEDKRSFKEARVALNKSNFLPRQLWFQQPNDDEVTWDFPQMKPNADVRPQEFVAPDTPTGWQMQHMR